MQRARRNKQNNYNYNLNKMKLKIIKNNLGTYDVYRIENGAQYFICTCKTKSEALGLTKESE
jgi:hypothetical protein